MSNFSIDNFRSEVLAGGLSKPNRFEVIITAPPCCNALLANNKFKMASPGLVSLFCTQASLPQTRILTSRQQIFGPPSYHPQGAEYGGDSLSLQFYLDTQMSVKTFFDTWMDGIVNRNTGEVYFANNYMCQGLTITQLDEEDDPTYRIKFDDVFPTAVTPLQLDHGMSNQVHKLNVTFNYRRWHRIEVEAKQPKPVTKAQHRKKPGKPRPAKAPAEKPAILSSSGIYKPNA